MGEVFQLDISYGRFREKKKPHSLEFYSWAIGIAGVFFTIFAWIHDHFSGEKKTFNQIHEADIATGQRTGPLLHEPEDIKQNVVLRESEGLVLDYLHALLGVLRGNNSDELSDFISFPVYVNGDLMGRRLFTEKNKDAAQLVAGNQYELKIINVKSYIFSDARNLYGKHIGFSVEDNDCFVVVVYDLKSKFGINRSHMAFSLPRSEGCLKIASIVKLPISREERHGSE
ncbi:MAG: hypothetical protein ACOY82_13585 [Pseudomonadota bacterium]